MFAPRRYVRVAGADAQFYINAESEDLMRQGESALAKWFTALPSDSMALGYSITKLRSRFPQVRQPKTRLRLYVPKGWSRDHAGQSTDNCISCAGGLRMAITRNPVLPGVPQSQSGGGDGHMTERR